MAMVYDVYGGAGRVVGHVRVYTNDIRSWTKVGGNVNGEATFVSSG